MLAALDVGIDTPTAIGEDVQSPTTVVSRVLRQLASKAAWSGPKRARTNAAALIAERTPHQN